MTHDEAVEVLKELKKHCQGMPITLEALDYAIAVMERPAAPGKAIDHSEQVLDMVTQFDERIASLRDSSKKDCLWEGYALSLMEDMQAHIRKAKL